MWRCALEENGELFVLMTGEDEKQLWSADSWAIEVRVKIHGNELGLAE